MLAHLCSFVQSFMLKFYEVSEIFGPEVSVSFKFALGAPHVKSCVKSYRPASVAPTREVDTCRNSFPYINHFIINKYCQHLIQDNQCPQGRPPLAPSVRQLYTNYILLSVSN